MRLEWRAIELHPRHPWTIARGTSTAKRNVLLRVSLAGTEGFGEAAPGDRYGENDRTVAKALAILGERLADVAAPPGGPSGASPHGTSSIGPWLDDCLDRIEAALPGDRAARAAVDIALHDWAGRRLGEPLYRRLGADPGRMPPTSMTIGLDAIPVMLEKVRKAEGFRILKVKVGTDRDREILKAIRGVTDRPLYADANEGWKDRDAALEMLRFMKDLGVVLVEQPLPAADLEGARYLRERAGLPIFADEAVMDAADVDRVRGAFDGVNVKVQKAGGLRAAHRAIERAREHGMSVLLGCMLETSIGIGAAAHLAPLADHVDLDGHLLL
ncbi:MAG: dipeptide epimerase, partial [Candidatus Polarisedimenticolia bacterium]